MMEKEFADYYTSRNKAKELLNNFFIKSILIILNITYSPL